MRRAPAVLTLLACLIGGGAHGDSGAGAQAYERGEYEQAFRLLKPAADAGDAGAQLRIGLMYYAGKGTRENDREAFSWFRRAAEQGLGEAQFQLAAMYMFGYGVTAPAAELDREAARWYLAAAEQGHIEAQYTVGLMLLAGTGFAQNPDEARLWMQRAAAQGHAQAREFVAGIKAAP